MTTQRLNPLDTAWLFTESRATPNHVGGLLIFRLPEDAPHDFLRQMMLSFRSHNVFHEPWNRKLKHPFNKNPFAVWVTDSSLDLEYHVRHSALPWPGGERELGELVGRLQSTPLDLSRPPWECTIIEGLEGGRFALFVKIHHSLIDGISGMKLLQRAMPSDRERSLKMPPFWAIEPPKHDPSKPDKPKRRSPTLAEAMELGMASLGEQVRHVPQLITAFTNMIKRVGQGGEGMAIPFDAPYSVLNGRVREKRRFATQQFELERLKAVAKAGGGTINDVVLTLCGGALRRFLDEKGQLPAKTLTAGIPVSVRPKDDEGQGNAISFIVAALGTDIMGAAERLEAVKNSVKHAKAHVQSLPRDVMQQYTMLLMAPTLLTMLTGMGGRLRPMFNVTISNVPGPEKPLYFMGAELLASYPASIVTHGQALNITCQSYAEKMNFGFTACHASLPSMQKIAVYAEDALTELEQALDLKPPKPGRAAALKAVQLAAQEALKKKKASDSIAAVPNKNEAADSKKNPASQAQSARKKAKA